MIVINEILSDKILNFVKIYIRDWNVNISEYDVFCSVLKIENFFLIFGEVFDNFFFFDVFWEVFDL